MAPLNGITLNRPGAFPVSALKLARPWRITPQSSPSAQPAASAAIALSTWKPIRPPWVSGTPASGSRVSNPPSIATRSPSCTNTTRPPWARCAASTGWSPSAAKKITLPGHCAAIAATTGSAALSTAKPDLATLRTTTRFSTARSSTVVMKFRPRWSPMPMLVTTATSAWSNASPSRSSPPRAVSNTAASTSGFISTLRALRGPEQSPESICTPLT